MHTGVWETVADTLFWLQLCWVFSGFLLMGYLAFKVFPSDDEQRSLQARSTSTTADKPQLIVLGSYRFEIDPNSSIDRS